MARSAAGARDARRTRPSKSVHGVRTIDDGFASTAVFSALVFGLRQRVTSNAACRGWTGERAADGAQPPRWRRHDHARHDRGRRRCVAMSPDRAHLYVLDLGAGELAPLADLPHCGAYITRRTKPSASHDCCGGSTDELKRARPRHLADRADPPDDRRSSSTASRRSAQRPRPTTAIAMRCANSSATVRPSTSTSHCPPIAPARLGHATEGLIAQRVLLRMAEAADYSMIGVRGVDPSQLPPGRGFLVPGGTEIQVALPGHAGLAAAVAAIAGRVATRRPARAIAVLPDVVSLIDVATEPPHARGLDRRHARPHVGTGRAGVGARRSRVDCRPGPFRQVDRHSRSSRTPHDATAPWCTYSLRPARRSCTTPRLPERAHRRSIGDTRRRTDRRTTRRSPSARRRRRRSRRRGWSSRATARGAATDVHIVATARADRLRAAFRHWTTEVRRSRVGILLRPDDIDGELLGVRLPRGALPPIAGAGYLVTEHGTEIVQWPCSTRQVTAA